MNEKTYLSMHTCAAQSASKHTFFEYGQKEIDYLKSRDAALGKAIDEIGLIRREVIPDIFMALINSIIGQQISAKAHKTVWERFQTMFVPVTPENIAELPVEKLQTCGISMQKATYIKEIASQVSDGSLDLAQLQTMSDDDVCKRLSQIKGIGVWTAEMLMIFSMQRMNVLSWGDMAIIRGLRMLYGHEKITPELFAMYKERYSPYATVASLYLWEISVRLTPKTEIEIDCDKLHTTKLGAERIKRNLGLEVDDVVSWCKQKVQESSSIIKKGKNWYVRTNDCVITINANSHTIITAHKSKK